MMKRETIEAVITEMARLQGHELNGHDRLKVRTHIASALTAQEQIVSAWVLHRTGGKSQKISAVN